MTEIDRLQRLLDHPDLQVDATSFDKALAFAVGLSRVAAGQELKDKTLEGPHLAKLKELDLRAELWPTVNMHLETMAKADPERALEAAVSMCLLPDRLDPKKKKLTVWMRSNGLTLFMNRELQPGLATYLNEGERNIDLATFFRRNMQTDLTPYTDDAAFLNPRGFSALQAMYDLYHLPATRGLAKELRDEARARRREPDVRNSVAIASKMPGCRYFNKLLMTDTLAGLKMMQRT